MAPTDTSGFPYYFWWISIMIEQPTIMGFTHTRFYRSTAVQAETSGRGGRGSGGRGGGGGRRRGQGRGGVQLSGGRSAGTIVNSQFAICHQWRDTGFCRYGTNCKYNHAGGSVGAAATTRKNISNSDIVRSVKHVSVLPVQKLGAELLSSAHLWRRAWLEEKTLDGHTRGIMLEVLAKVPGSSSVEPPPIELCEEAIHRFLEDNHPTDEAALTAMKTVLDVVTRLLLFEWDCNRDHLKNWLSRIVLMAEGKLRKQHKDHREVASRFILVLEELDMPWRLKMRELTAYSAPADNNLAAQALTYADWKSANIKWLCNPLFFAPSCCPIMQVGKAGVYDSPAHYMDTVHRLWSGMTFSDGHTALAPHCRSRGATGGACGNALWPTSGQSLHTYRCRSNGCMHPVEFACRIKSHDVLCGDCSSRSIARHLEGPGQGASTHLYDCKVSHVDHDGVLYLVDFQSRSSPPNIHWRTTRRLSPPNLVGIVQARAKGSPLSESDLVKWGEVVYHGHNRDEERRRKNGDVAINISSVNDVDPDFFEEGSYVVVVDCMSFVPEWIPVLKALESQKDSRLPFEDGKLLNLTKGSGVEFTSAIVDSSPDDIFSSDRRSLIEAMVKSSDLEPIREIRCDELLRDELVNKLDRLVTEATLDKMQLVSFVDSLRVAVHLTQGPPGTGKSYFGVVLVRALMIVRDLWLKKSKSIGTAPILVLSYKNQAIDHFLLDLVKAEPTKLSFDKLIRIGGSCKESRLARFSERNSFQSDVFVKAKRTSLQKLNALRDSIHETLNGPLSSFLSFQHLMFGECDDHTRRKAGNDATEFLLECIVRRRLLLGACERKLESPDDVIQGLAFLQTDVDRKPSQQIQYLVARGVDCVSKLELDVLQYQQKHWGDLLLMWLSGKVPLPRCSFTCAEQSLCDGIALSHDIALCDYHRCQFSGSIRCAEPLMEHASHFCKEHSCAVEECNKQKLRGKQIFCTVHASKKFVELELLAKLSLSRPPRNVCDDHPLCTFPSCPCFCEKNEIYCRKHVSLVCNATTTKKKACKGTPISRYKPFCQDHIHLAGNVNFEVASDDLFNSDDSKTLAPRKQTKTSKVLQGSKCRATTRKGHPCKGEPQPGSSYCYDHSLPVVQKHKSAADDEATPAAIIEEIISTGCEKSQSSLRLEHSNFNSKAGQSGVSEKHDSPSVSSSVSLQSAIMDHIPAELISVDVSLQSALTEHIPAELISVEVDEIDFEYEAENLQHLRDIFEIQDEDDIELLRDNDQEIESKLGSESDSKSAAAKVQPVSCDPNQWTWSMTVETRWRACQNLMEDLRHRMNKASTEMKVPLALAKRELKKAKDKAKTKVYENKSVIGGTMLGCISRLESIKATRPFAVIVEEASEVLEPLLFSCLSESTVKLEMIGDHRQLQPNVMSRFDFEIFNKVNVSMFQRLIEAPKGQEIPSSVLSVQRRMRKNICELTREYYVDVVKIEDHERCSLQVIGERSSQCFAQSVASGGREIPGIAPHVYLWTHGNAQTRANIGVSRINHEEASRVCSLAEYLVECGVPRSSIAILTPYKGQLMHIRSMLLKSAVKMISKDPKNEDVCRISTVDRFQGDEEDIIICSLVVDENSRTGFVKLLNRMVVLLSRARLGLYLVANSGFLGNATIPGHWGKTLKILEGLGSNDSLAPSVESRHIYCGSRSGPELPLCCPAHRDVIRMAKSASDIRLGFCTEWCQAVKPCGHTCSLSCHWPKDIHNKKCIAKLKSPCKRHPGVINCHFAFGNTSGMPVQTGYEDVMTHFKCPDVVSSTLPCGHIVQVPCWVEKQITCKSRPWPVCNESSPTLYTYPSCGHTRQATCAEKERFTETPSLVQCEKVGEYTPSCGHVQSMMCWSICEYEKGLRVYDCQTKVLETLPRCGHKHKVMCGITQKIADWNGRHCLEIGCIREGETYGLPDYLCNKEATIVRSCGHNLKLPCAEAFLRASTLNPCREKIRCRHPLCGHDCFLACNELSTLTDVIPNVVEEYIEGQITPLTSVNFRAPRCSALVKLRRKCNHVTDIRCSEVRKPLHPCKEPVRCMSSFCGHHITLSCCVVGDISNDVWSAEIFSTLCSDHRIEYSAKTLQSLGSLSPQVKDAYQSCAGFTTVILVCGHEKPVKCSELLRTFSGLNATALQCTVPSQVMLICGHKVEVPCFESDQILAGRVVSCQKTKVTKCWNYAICKENVRVRCVFDGPVACNKAIKWICPDGKHQYDIKRCSKGKPLDCPRCSSNKLSAAINDPQKYPLPSLLSIIDVLPSTCITALQQNFTDFDLQEKKLFKQYQAYLTNLSEPEWSLPLFTLRRIPCFRKRKEISRWTALIQEYSSGMNRCMEL